MKITFVNIPADITGNGLSDVKMDRLGNVVLLAGKNGSGKSRILDLLVDFTQKHNGLPLNEKLTRSVYAKQRISLENKQIEISNQRKLQAINDKNHSAVASYEFDINSRKNNMLSFYHSMPWEFITMSGNDTVYVRAIKYVPKTSQLANPNKLNKLQLTNESLSTHDIGVDRLHTGTLCKIQHAQNRWFEVTNPNSTVDLEIRNQLVGEYEKLRDLVELFLDTKLSRNEEGDATLFGFGLGDAKMSEGQKLLLQYAVAIHSQGGSLDNVILFLDEPENSLHPAAVIETIERIKKCVPDGQIWIATHSIPILAHFDPSCIWYVENGKVSHAGKIPEKVLESLLGGEDEHGRLQDFINLPAVYALNMHAYESLFQPQAVETGKNDPQTLQIRDELKAFLKDNDKIKVLDYGAGKGRLLTSIIEHNNQTKEEFTKWFDYVAYDRFDGDKEHCINTIKHLYDTAEIRYFNDNNKIYEKHDKNSFDVVVMCNVLHEIDPKDWIDLFKNIIPEMLTENGILLLVEDHEMPIGEKAYQKGYIVLDTTELKDLFNITGGELEYNDARGDGRLKAHRIKKQHLLNITADTRKKALESLHKKAKGKVLEMRNKELTYVNGKKHGFWLQQYANTGLALSEF
jgi:ABC-type multidrug transport system ATPase subunit